MLAERRIHRNHISIRFVVIIAASLLAFLHLVGRWDFSRLVGKEPTLWSEGRLWIAIALVFLTAIRGFSVGRGRRRNNAMNGSMFIPILLYTLFTAYMVSTAFWSDDAALALSKIYDYTFLLGIVWLLFIWNYDWEISVWFWNAILVLGTALAFIALLGLSPGASPNPDRLSTLGGGPNVFGRNMGLLSLFCTYLAFRATRRRQFVFWAAASAFMYVMVVLTGSRGALMATVCGTAILVALELGRRRISPKQLVRLCAVGGVALVLAIFSPAGPRITRFFKHRLMELTILEGYTAGRDEVYLSSLRVIQENPVFGIGLESFYARALGRYPHNPFLEVWVEGGFVGGFLFLAVGVAFVLTLWNNRRRLDSCGVAALVQAFVAAQFSGDIYDNRGVLVFMLLALSPGLRIYGSTPSNICTRQASQLGSSSCGSSQEPNDTARSSVRAHPCERATLGEDLIGRQ